MNSDAQHPVTTSLTQSALARAGTSGSRIHTSGLPVIAQRLREHGYSAWLRPSGGLQLTVGTSRFTAHVLDLPGAPIEVRVRREGKYSLLGLIHDPDEAAHLLIRCAGMSDAWALVGDIYDRLVLSGDNTALAEVPISEVIFVRLGERTFAEFTADRADACAGVPARVQLTTLIAAHSVDTVWNMRSLIEQDFPIIGRISGGVHETADTAMLALAAHRDRAPEWERLH